VILVSVLDLCPIVVGGDAAQAFANSRDLAQHAERWGFRRFWLAEHHSMPGIASAATSLVISHVAAATSTIRVGAGGIMLPNHAPLVIAEQFGTLASLYPDRIDRGLGRAPGTDPVTSHALRRTLASDPEAFPQDVIELMSYFEPVKPGQKVRAVPGAGLEVDFWILGSSLFGAQVAAALGLPFSFASHFAPAQMMEAIEVYRARYRPSAKHPRPYVMLGYNVFAADTDDEARLVASSMQQAFVNLRTGRPGRLGPPVAGYEASLAPGERAILAGILSCSAIGSPPTVKAAMTEFATRTGADELIIASMVYDHAARLKSYEIAAQVARG
jgi:luciferase family oxidoreductase group 1